MDPVLIGIIVKVILVIILNNHFENLVKKAIPEYKSAKQELISWAMFLLFIIALK